MEETNTYDKQFWLTFINVVRTFKAKIYRKPQSINFQGNEVKLQEKYGMH